MVGGATGSFLNVVVYRLPSGGSLLYPPSRCPACESPIRWYDNVPILAWLWLAGRCRDCGGKISIRYPLVEAATALLFLALAEIELFSGGANLPLGAATDAATTLQGGIPVRLWGLYAGHLLLLCTLLAAGLIAWDGHRVPARLYGPALVVGLVGPAIWPWMRPLATTTAGGWLTDSPAWLVSAAEGVIGAAIGMMLSGLRRLHFDKQRSRIDKQRAFDFTSDLLAAAGVGLLLGASAVAVLVAIAAVVQLGMAVFARVASVAARDVWLAGLGVATFAWIALWGKLIAWDPAWGGKIDLFTLVVAALAVFACGLLADRLVDQRHSRQ